MITDDERTFTAAPADVSSRSSASAEKAEAALRLEVASVLFGDTKPPERLRERVRELTAALREIGLAPEAALIRVKAAMFTAGLTGVADRLSHTMSSSDRVLICETLVTWCIESYFEETQRHYMEKDSITVPPGLTH